MRAIWWRVHLKVAHASTYLSLLEIAAESHGELGRRDARLNEFEWLDE